MIVPRALLLSLALSLGPCLPAKAEPALPDRVRSLATCEARYSAVLQHSWLEQGHSEAARLRRDLFAAMLRALLAADADHAGMERRVLRLRISEKHATRRLLESARFSDDPRRARIAQGQVTRALSLCDRIVIRERAPVS